MIKLNGKNYNEYFSQYVNDNVKAADALILEDF